MNNWLHSAHVSKQQSRQEPKCSNTSTDVEKTRPESSSRRRAWKHLHGRGEDTPSPFAPKSLTETPPRTWRRRLFDLGRSNRVGNTSTDVEKTLFPCQAGQRRRKHLHGRGEDPDVLPQVKRMEETPPRTWRRPKKWQELQPESRNTSTDVEKTNPRTPEGRPDRKHLHGRGEDSN